MYRSLLAAFAVVLLASSLSYAQGPARKGRRGGPPGAEAGRGEQMIQQLFAYGDVNRDGFLNVQEFNRSKTALGNVLNRRRGPSQRPPRGSQPEAGDQGAERGPGPEGKEGGPNLAAFNSNPDKNNDKVVSLNEFTDWVTAVMGRPARPEGEGRPPRPERKAD